MEETYINLMDDMHLENKSLFMQYFQALNSGDLITAEAILNNNPSLKDQIMSSQNINSIITGVNRREEQPKEEIDYYLDDLFQQFINSINNMKTIPTFSIEVQYEELNLVYYNDMAYFAYNRPPKGTLPTDTNYWIEYDIKGLQGYGGVSNLNYMGNWSSSTNYNAGDVVIYQNKMWQANATNVGRAPDLSYYPWLLIMMPAMATKTPIQTLEPNNYAEGTFWFQIIEGEDISQTTWKISQPEITGRFSSASFVIGNSIYVVGGENAYLDKTNTNEAFDTVTKTWSQKAAYPNKADNMAGFSIGDIGFCTGGLLENLSYSADTYSYNASTNAWTKKANLPLGQAFNGDGVGNSSYGFVGCGIDQNGMVGKLYKYNNSSNAWQEISTLPTAKIGAVILLDNNNLYVIGGVDSNGNITDTIENYNISSNTWITSTISNMSKPKAYAGGAIISGDIYIIGGLDYLSYSSPLVEKYNRTTSSWVEIEPMNYPRNNLISQAVNNKGYAIGGIDIFKQDVGGYTEIYGE